VSSPILSPILYAHRGAAAELPENTLSSFRRALDAGAGALETDVHMTRDGHVVVSHDATGERMAGVVRAIRHATLDEVRSWDAGFGFIDRDGARPFVRKGFRIPTLEEMLAEFPGIPINVDAKQRVPDMVPALLDVVRRARSEDRVLLASFDARTLVRIRRLGYSGPTGLAQAEVVRLIALPILAHRVLPLRGDVAQLPHRQSGINLGTRAVIAKCHTLGLLVHYWTVNDPARATELLDYGADGIMTDDPAAIAPVFAARALTTCSPA
jgi:glycerophosphoryl diester phosphodiesterase